MAKLSHVAISLMLLAAGCVRSVSFPLAHFTAEPEPAVQYTYMPVPPASANALTRLGALPGFPPNSVPRKTLLAASIVSAPLAPTRVTLLWEEESNSVPAVARFDLHQSGDLTVPLNNWPVVASLSPAAGGLPLDATGTNNTFSLTLLLTPGTYFFYVTALDAFWQTTVPSNIARTPALASAPTALGIHLGP